MADIREAPRPWEALGLELGGAWPHWPASVRHADVAGVATDDSGRVYLFTRMDSQVLVFSPDGTFVHSFGHGLFSVPHAITVDPEGCVYCTDCGDSTVRKFSPSGELLMTLGRPHEESDTGWSPREPADIRVHDVEGVRYPGPPFNGCTDLAIGPTGELYVADGYRNCQIHRFTAAGELIDSWGGVGTGLGEFHLPHAVVVDGERLLVADRENDRIQLFDLTGAPLGEWTGFQRPTDIAIHPDGRIFVSELWRPPGNRGFVADTAAVDQPSRMSVLSGDGKILGRWGAGIGGDMDGYFIAPHALAIDGEGRIYVGEVTRTFAIDRGLAGMEFAGHQVQRFLSEKVRS